MNVFRRKHTAKNWPRTVEAAVGTLLVKLHEDDLNYLRNMKESERWGLHHGFGTSIRNSFGLWRGNDALLKDCKAAHPDDASSVIIDALLKRLKENGDETSNSNEEGS